MEENPAIRVVKNLQGLIRHYDWAVVAYLNGQEGLQVIEKDAAIDLQMVFEIEKKHREKMIIDIARELRRKIYEVLNIVHLIALTRK